ncbi:MAG: sigma 54-interacting transcriptional regulator [Candidatus Cloacimonas sp.]|jgi:transcriptional regulator with PAS, ATPase and Fis domain|nr:sigma 54-interacting transcriptional regulator [Candidatus Cloacimonas sp.]
MTPASTDLKLLQKALDDAIIISDAEAIIKASKDLVMYHQGKGETAICATHIKAMMPYLRLLGKLGDVVHNLDYLGKCYMLLDEYQEAEDAFSQVLQIYEEKKIDLGIADVETNLGILFRHKGDFDLSLKHLNKAITIFQQNMAAIEAGSNPQPINSYINAIECCGVIHGQMHQYEQSIQFLKDALALKERFGNTSSQVSALMNLGVTYSEFDLDKATEYYLKALELLDEKSPPYHKVLLLNNLGGCLEDVGNLDGALKYYQKALEAMESADVFHYQAAIYKHLGIVLYKQGSFDAALEMIEKSMTIAQKNDEKSELKDCYLAFSDIYTAKYDYKEALNYRVKYDAIKEEIFQHDIGTQLNSLQKKYQSTAQNVHSLRQEKSLISNELKKAMNTGFVGISESIKEVQRLAFEASIYKDTRVLITGESGVGKEIVARFIHYSDTINIGRFVDVNCCSIPESMAESEFFGYVKGAFTGAINGKEGYFEEANQGSLFLDEIGDMPMVLQAKLLRVLETKQVKRLGSNKAIKIGFRLISATNKDLSSLILENRFRGDLVYRINTIQIHIPPLRDRKEDIKPLLDYYLNEYASKMNKAIPSYGPEVIACLNEYPFPGNVRELRNMIEKAMIFLKEKQLRSEDFICQMVIDGECCLSHRHDMNLSLNDFEVQKMLQTIKDCNGNQTLAAQKLGIPYSTFRRKFNKIRGDR